MASKAQSRKVVDKVLTSLGLVATLVLFAVGGLAWWAYSFTTSNVHDQLAQQQIFFPPAGSAAITALPAADQAQMNKYAGQQLLTGAQAKVYANNFIAVHLSEVADGQTYAQVSTKSLADPTNTQLQGQANTLFKGETLRGLLLGDAYAFGTVGMIARIAAFVAFVGGGVMLLLVLLGLRHMMSL